MMYQKQNKRRKRSKKFFKALHIIVITLKYAFKILKELKAIIFDMESELSKYRVENEPKDLEKAYYRMYS